MKIQDLLQRKKDWTQGSNARSIHGNPVPHGSKNAVCFCLVGALLKCYGEGATRDNGPVNMRFIEIAQKIEAAISSNNYPTRSYLAFTLGNITRWNDSEHTKWIKVKQLIKKLDI